MAVITSYSTLVTEVQAYLARGDMAAAVPGFIQNFETRFYRQPKNWGRWMESAFSQAIASSVIAVPSDWLGFKKALYVSGSPSTRLDWVSLDQCYGLYPRGADTARPVVMARDSTNFVFGPAPDSDYTIKGVYYAKPTALRSAASDAALHYLITDLPDLCLYGALLEAEPYIKNDARIPVWRAYFGQALQDYRDGQKEEELVSFEVLG